ncbi:DUF1461 domain-containing protein [Spongiibacter sp. KMU-158]|uniref:DUF1461 domain-containing protein n=1 Tax=Spongiibacter pelagi TaxID=2760804 RepID=A0A927C3R7_9GAMM|nr:DUF1461 domain-containing protein [Spongiibacter pelagi]MBD2859221.1 DUF1461 domain-containing protein [Spongiibacter pelagi]
MNPSARRFITNPLYALLSLIVSLGLAWQCLALMDYGYGFWHDHAGIGENIDQYGPENRYRSGFEHTSREQRIRLFSEIVESVHHNGNGLEAIHYQADKPPASTSLSIPLLHRAELVHLQDVANLIHTLEISLAVLTVFWVLWSGLGLCRQWPLPNLKQQAISAIVLCIALTLLLALFGFEKVFYQLHIWIFPDNHQWFFYYQDSLMSTMMKAPDLFAYIGLTLGLLGVAFFIAQAMIIQSLKKIKTATKP